MSSVGQPTSTVFAPDRARLPEWWSKLRAQLSRHAAKRLNIEKDVPAGEGEQEDKTPQIVFDQDQADPSLQTGQAALKQAR